MSAFVTVGSGWFVEDIGDDLYPVYTVWSDSGKKLFGVAGSDGMEDLLERAALGLVKGGERPKKGQGFRFRFARVGPRPLSQPATDTIEVLVAQAKGRGWHVAGMRDVRQLRAGKRSR